MLIPAPSGSLLQASVQGHEAPETHSDHTHRFLFELTVNFANLGAPSVTSVMLQSCLGLLKLIRGHFVLWTHQVYFASASPGLMPTSNRYELFLFIHQANR